MRGPGLAALLASWALLLAGCDDNGDTTSSGPEPKKGGALSELEGGWSGKLRQNGLDPFEVAVRFSGRISVAYTEIDCGGNWGVLGVLTSNPPEYEFQEMIDRGAGGDCEGKGDVSLMPLEACPSRRKNDCRYEHLRYRFNGGGVTSKGVLTRATATELEKIFHEAGVELPE